MSENKQNEEIKIEKNENNKHQYSIGMEIVAVDSDYAGLTGVITEIHSTKNEKSGEKGLVIFCDFEVPKGAEKHFEDMTLNSVEMAPEMLIEKLPELSVSERCELSLNIIKQTNDGDDLDPRHLKLTENGVNGFLNAYGEYLLRKLHEEVISGQYQKPWFHGVEHMTYDNEGYVYYKGQHVEHYTRSWGYSEEAKQNLIELKSRCEYLESHGKPVNSITAVWSWDNNIKLPVTKRFRDNNGNLSVSLDELAALTKDDADKYFVSGQRYSMDTKEYTLNRYFENDVEMLKFTSDDGHEIFTEADKAGTFLPDIASEGMEITRIISQENDSCVEQEDETEI